MEGLPVELFHRICDFLCEESMASILVLRCVSSYCAQASFDTFKKQCFTTRTFDLSRNSLQALSDVSKHEGFSGTVRVLRLMVDPLGRSKRQLRSASYRDSMVMHIEDQWSIEIWSLDREMLTTALSNFENIESIEVSSPRGQECWDGYNGYEERWSDEELWGHEHANATQRCAMMHATTRFLTSIATAQPRLSHLSVKTDTFYPEHAIHPRALDIPSPIAINLRGVLENLCSLELHLWNGLARPITNRDIDRDAARICDFISAAPNLLTLRLHCAQELEGQLRICSKIAAAYQWPQLRNLTLGNFTLKVQGFIDLLAAHKGTLEYLQLISPTLADGDFRMFFRWIRDQLSLEHLILGSVRANPRGHYVFFPSDIADRSCQELLEVTGLENIRRAMTRAISDGLSQARPPSLF